MNWKPIDFHKLISLNHPLEEQLELYLTEKETSLSNVILTSISDHPGENYSPLIDQPSYDKLKLSETTELFGKQISKIIQNKSFRLTTTEWKTTADWINDSLWNYVEILEGNCVELFLQIDRMSFEKWHKDLPKVLARIKEILMSHIEELIWTVQRIEKHLKDYRQTCLDRNNAKNLKNFVFSWKSILDPILIKNLEKSKKYLIEHYDLFTKKYNNYTQFQPKIEQSLNKFTAYPILNTLEIDHQHLYIKLYFFIKIWEKNIKLKILPQTDTTRALNNIISPEKGYGLLKSYYQALEKALYDTSRNLKELPIETFQEVISKKKQLDRINLIRAESHTLGATIAKFRNFLLRTDPNPYIRNRWGFTEWIVGTEPTNTKNLLTLGYETENLDKLFQEINQALQKGPEGVILSSVAKIAQDAQYQLHEMGQPLSSRSLMKVKGDRLIDSLNEMNELGSFNPHVVEFIGKALSKALRVDWKYHVLQENHDFHTLALIHQNICGNNKDREHLNRIEKFSDLTNQIQDWVVNHATLSHTYEIEVDMNDIKECLQGFLAYVRRIVSALNTPLNKKNEEMLYTISQQLFEYRYLFGNFFHILKQYETDEKLLRHKFIFVDQYFESVENILNDISVTHSPSK